MVATNVHWFATFWYKQDWGAQVQHKKDKKLHVTYSVLNNCFNLNPACMFCKQFNNRCYKFGSKCKKQT